MTAPVDVLSVMARDALDAAIKRQWDDVGHAMSCADESELASDAVAELLAADIELDAAELSLQKAGRCGAPERVRRFDRFLDAKVRRVAAVARCRGGKPA